MEWTDTAVVLKIGHFRERDVWVRLLTRKHGIIQVFAFGGARSRRRFPGCLDVLNRLSVRIASNRTGRFWDLAEAAVLIGPHRLREDTVRLGMAMNCLRFIEAMNVTGDESISTFETVCALLDVLESGDQVSELLPVLFRLRMASDQGYVPDFSHCARCGAALLETCSGASWHAGDGVVRCTACADALGQGSRLSPGMVAAVSVITHGMPDQWHIEGLPVDDRRKFAEIIDELISYHVGLSWGNGHFVRV